MQFYGHPEAVCASLLDFQPNEATHKQLHCFVCHFWQLLSREREREREQGSHGGGRTKQATISKEWVRFPGKCPWLLHRSLLTSKFFPLINELRGAKTRPTHTDWRLVVSKVTNYDCKLEGFC